MSNHLCLSGIAPDRFCELPADHRGLHRHGLELWSSSLARFMRPNPDPTAPLGVETPQQAAPSEESGTSEATNHNAGLFKQRRCSVIIGSLKCKICGKEIEPPPLVIGEYSSEDRDKRVIARVLQHLSKRAEMEKAGGGPHLEAIQKAAATCMHISSNLNGALLTGNFELPEDLEQQRLSLLRQVHEMTRQVRMSNQELIEQCDHIQDCAGAAERALRIMLDLRDRYESLGRYAPAQPAPAAPEEVKR